VANAVAIYTNIAGAASPWTYLTPREGWKIYNRSADVVSFFDGVEWSAHSGNDSVNAQTGTTYTLAKSDNRALVGLSNAGTITVTVPTNASVPLPIGFRVKLRKVGAGDVTFSVTGITIVGQLGAVIPDILGQFSTYEIQKVATDTWQVLSCDDYNSLSVGLTGMTTTPTIALAWARTGRVVTLYIPTSTAGTSNATTMATDTALAVGVRPSTAKKANIRAVNNGAAVFGSVEIQTGGILHFTNGAGSTLGNFTASGNKGTLHSSISFGLD